MKRFIENQFLVVITCSFILSMLSFLFLLFELKNMFVNDLELIYPVSDLQVLIFLSRPLFLLIPFVIGTTLLGSYIISRIWMKDVMITTSISEKNGTVIKNSKIKFLSDDEKHLFKLIMDHDDEIYQNDLVQLSGLPKYTVSRILSRFESYGIIRKERYGMTNRIWLTVHQIELE